MWRSPGKAAQQVIQEEDLGLVADTDQLHSICQKVVDSHPREVRTVHPEMTASVHFWKKTQNASLPAQVDAIRNGNKKVLNKLMGLVQKETKGRADPVLVRAILQDKTS